MKTVLLLLLGIFLIPAILIAQPVEDKQSFFGDVHTPKGALHILIVFVRYENDSRFSDPDWPDVSKEGVLPDFAMGETNSLFNNNPDSIGIEGQIPNLSDYYFQMSGGQFRITADIFPIQVPVKYISGRSAGFFARQQNMNQEAVEWIAENYPDFDWGKYDHRTNNPKYNYNNTNSLPDSVVDYAVFIHREPGGFKGSGSPGRLNIPNSNYSIRDGHTALTVIADKEHMWEFFNHEFAHNIYSSPHYMSANKTDGDKFYTQKGWALINSGNTSFATANAWECWWLGWLDPQTVFLSGEYQIKDYVTNRDAVRIAIPGTQQYLWIENHQKRSFWDDKLYYKNPEKGYPQSAKGLYMYITHDRVSSREGLPLNPFRVQDANFTKMLNAEGNFDYEPTGDSIPNEFFRAPVFRRKAPNPLAGQNDFQFIRYDFNDDDRILIGRAHGNTDRGGGEQMDVWALEKQGVAQSSINTSGDEFDAFDVGDELSLSGKMPVVNYPTYDNRRQKLQPFLINGLNIKVKNKDEEGNYTISVDYDDWEIRNDTRWCGNIELSSKVPNPERTLSIMSKASLTLDQGGTPDRSTKHSVSGTFTNPTHMLVDSKRILRITKKGTLIVDNNSTLELKDGGFFILEPGGKLIVRNGGKVIVTSSANMTVQKKAKIFLGPEAEITDLNSEQINVNKKAKIKTLKK